MDTYLSTDPAHLDEWAEDFRATYGCYPIAGAETPEPGAGGAAPAPAPAGTDPGQAPGGEGDPPADTGLERLEGRMDQLVNQLGPMAERLQSLPVPDAPPDPAQQRAAQTLEQFFGAAPSQQQPGDPQQPPAGQLPGPDPDDEIRQLMDPLVQRELDQRVRPAFEQILTRIEQSDQARQQDRISEQTASLYSEYPQLQNDPQYRGQVVGEAQAWAQDMGADEQVARSPVFIELVHLAHQTLDRAAQENPAGQQQGPGPLGGPAGASLPPQGQPSEQDRAQQIVEAGPPRGGIFG